MHPLRWITPAVVVALASAVAVVHPQSREAPPLGGKFSDRAESLGFDQYRRLDADEQLDRRKDAKRWVRIGNESNVDRVDLDPFATAVGYCPYLPEAWLRYGQGLNELGRYEAAQYCLDLTSRTLKYEADEDERRKLTGEFHRLSAVVAFNTGNVEICHEHANAALQIKSKDDALELLLARVLVDLDRFDEARRVLSRFDDSSPAWARALATTGLLEMGQGRHEAAEDAFARAYKYGMRGPIFENDRGRLYLAMDRLDAARGHFEAAIGSLPTFMEARNNLAVSYRREGRIEDAQRALEEALELQPDYAPAHFNLAEVLREQIEGADENRRRQLALEALDQYDQAMIHGYDLAAVMPRRAELALSVSDLQAAEEDLLAMTEDPDIDGRVLFLLGRVKKQQRELQVAEKLYRMALERGHRHYEVYSDLGEVQLRRGELEPAKASLQAALELNPDLVVTRVNLCIVFVELQDYENANLALREAEARAPEHALVRAQRAVLKQLGFDS